MLIFPGEKGAPVAFLVGGNSHVLRLCRGETRMCCISPGEKRACAAFPPKGNRMLFGITLFLCLRARDKQNTKNERARAHAYPGSWWLILKNWIEAIILRASLLEPFPETAPIRDYKFVVPWWADNELINFPVWTSRDYNFVVSYWSRFWKQPQ